MNKYQQITSHERYIIAAIRKQGLNQSDIARHLGRPAARSPLKYGATAVAFGWSISSRQGSQANRSKTDSFAAQPSLFGRRLLDCTRTSAQTMDPGTDSRSPTSTRSALVVS